MGGEEASILLSPSLAAALETDWDSMWLFMKPEDDGVVWRMRASDVASGWQLSTATWGGYGRKVRGGEGRGAALDC